MKTIEVVLNEKRNVRLTAFIQDVEKEYRNITKRPGVLVIPGGGYMFCSDREAEPVALAYLNAGYDAFILRSLDHFFRSDQISQSPSCNRICLGK